MQKQGKSRKALLVGIAAAVVILAALVALLLTQCVGFGDSEATTAATEEAVPGYELYWNLDRALYDGKSEAGMSSREPEADGLFHIRFNHNGEEITLKTKSRKLVNSIDVMDIMGLVFDEDGLIVEVLNLEDMPLEMVAWAFHVQSVGGNTIKANSSETFEGMEVLLQHSGDAYILDMVGKEGPAGCRATPVEGDRIYAIKNLAGELTHLYIYDRPTFMLYHEDYCAHCKETVKWGEWIYTNKLPVKTGHYQLQSDIQLTGQQSMTQQDQKICVDLNGKRVDGKDGKRIYSLHNVGSVLAIMDTSEGQAGVIAAHGDGDQGMCAWARYGQLYLYSGTLDASDAETDAYGTAVQVNKNSYFFMHGGTIIGGRAKVRLKDNGTYDRGLGGALHVGNAGKFVMHDGVIRDGYAESVTTYKDGKKSVTRGMGGNLFIANGAEVELRGGVIKNGYAGGLGGNIMIDGTATLLIEGGRIEGGKVTGEGKNGGNIYAASSKTVITMNGGVISGGISYNAGGNLYVGKATFIMNGGTITGGKCYNFATGELNTASQNYNVFCVNGIFKMNGGRINGGFTLVDSSAKDKWQGTLTLGGNAIISSAEENASNLYIRSDGLPKVVVNKLGATAKIGVYTTRGIFTAPTAQQNADKFYSDIPGAEVLYTSEGLALGRYRCICGRMTHANGCDGTVHMWGPWPSANTLPKTDGNYFLVQDVTTSNQTWVAQQATVRLDLNGKNATYAVPAEKNDGFRLYVADWKSNLIITDTTHKPGIMKTVMKPASEVAAVVAQKLADGSWTQEAADKVVAGQAARNAGMLLWARGGNIVLHNGILDNSANSGTEQAMTVNLGAFSVDSVKNNATFVMHNGHIKGATSSSYGCSVYGGSGSTVAIHGGIIEGGTTTDNSGGNIYINNGTLYMDGGIIRNGYAASSGGNLTVVGAKAKATITGTAQILDGVSGDPELKKDYGRGGNIRLTTAGATLTIDGNALISGGTVYRSANKKAGYGGNINANTGTILNIKGGTIKGGTSTYRGGSVYLCGEMNMSGGTITGGEATSRGGNIHSIEGAQLNVTGGVVSNGTSDCGGNISLEGSKAVLAGGTITDGHAVTKGGNLYTDAEEKLLTVVELKGVAIQKGISDTAGGNLYLDKNTNLTMSAGSVTDGEANNGGNIALNQNTVSVTMTGGKVADGTATRNGGNFFLSEYQKDGSGTLTVKGGTISGGSANGDGDSLFVNGDMTVSDGTISNGEIYIYSANKDKFTVDFTGGVVENATVIAGGNVNYAGTTFSGTHTNVYGTVTMSDGLVTGGSAKNGGNFLVYGTLNISGGTITKGVATGKEDANGGGNIYVTDNKAVVNVTGGTISGGMADGEADGGNINVNKGQLEITGGTVTSGKVGAAGNGQGIYVGWNGKFALSGNAEIYGNNGQDISLCGNKDRFVTLGKWDGNGEKGQLIISRVDLSGANALVVKFDDTVTDVDSVAGRFGTDLADTNVRLNGDHAGLVLSSHYHCLCAGNGVGEGDHTTCTNVDFVKITDKAGFDTYFDKDGVLKADASLCLTEGITLTKEYKTGSHTLNLCLGGQTITMDGGRLTANGTTGVLNITDCDTNPGSIVGAQGAAGSLLYTWTGHLNLYAGTVDASKCARVNNGAVIYLGQGGDSFNMYDGTLIGGSASKKGGVIYCAENGTVNILDGTISGGKAGTLGGGIAMVKGALSITGGTITGCTAGSDTNGLGGGAISMEYNCTRFELSGNAKIYGNTGVTGDENAVGVDVRLNGRDINYITLGDWAGNDNNAKVSIFKVSAAEGSKVVHFADGMTETQKQAALERFAANNGELKLKLAETGLVLGYVHEHCICAGNAAGVADHTTCTDVSFTKVADKAAFDSYFENGVLKADASLYLDGDITLTEEYKTGGFTLNLCLGGQTITMDGGRLTANGTTGVLNITDCEATPGSIVGAQGAAGSLLYTWTGHLNLYAGTVDASKCARVNNGAVIYLGQGGDSFNMYDGTLIGGSASKKGGVIYCAENGTVNILGGTISGGKAGTLGGGIAMVKGALSITGGAITGCTAGSDTNGLGGGAVSMEYNCTRFELSGDAKIYGNTGVTGDENAVGVDVRLNGRDINYITLGDWAGNDNNAKVSIFKVSAAEGSKVVHFADGLSDADKLAAQGYFASGDNGFNLIANSANTGLVLDKIHTHCLCNETLKGDAAHTCAPLTFQKVADTEDFLTYFGEDKTLDESVNLCLTGTVELNAEYKLDGKTLNLCLNGQTVKLSGDGRLTANGTTGVLNITDCDTNKMGMIQAQENCGRAILYTYKGDINLYDGIVDATKTVKDSKDYTTGGAVFVDQADDCFTMFGGEVKGSTTEIMTNGGAIFCKLGSVVIKNGTVTGGKATNGGSIYVDAGGSLTVESGLITGGHASRKGGNVFLYGGPTSNPTEFSMTNGTITLGVAVGSGDGDGGGNLYLSGNSSNETFNAAISGGTISNGQAQSTTKGDGGNINVNRGSLTISGGTVTGGSAGRYCGGLYIGWNVKSVTLSGTAKIQENGAQDLYISFNTSKKTNYLTLGDWAGNEAGKEMKIGAVAPGSTVILVAPQSNEISIDLTKFSSANAGYSLILNTGKQMVLKAN